MRQLLDRVYALALLLSALCLVMIGLLVFIQVIGRVLDRVAAALGLAPVGLVVTSLAEIGGFLFVAAVCLGMAPTLKAGGHVRVSMLLRVNSPRLAQGSTLLVLVAAIGLVGFAAWNSALQAADSWAFDSVSVGIVRVPLWLPQGAMTAGLAILFIALLDEFATALRGRIPAFRLAEIARDQAGGGTDGH